jgi:CspA family cold shock protein
MKGTVKWFDRSRGYGFITTINNSGEAEDIFVHFSCILQDGYKLLVETTEVEFDIGEGRDGRRQAFNVKSL